MSLMIASNWCCLTLLALHQLTGQQLAQVMADRLIALANATPDER